MNIDTQPKKEIRPISSQAIRRTPYYLQYLRRLQAQGLENVAASHIAAYFKFTEIQVRKDFAAVSSIKGKPKYGFAIKELIYDMEEMLGYHNVNQAVLVGTGSLGRSLLGYRRFEAYGLEIVAAFDNDPGLIGRSIGDKKILPTGKISDLCKRMNIHIGIIAVPEDQAQLVCDELIAGDVRAIWNFAPIHLTVPDGTLVQNENMAASLALLSKHLREKMEME